jgi:host factor-I protein
MKDATESIPIDGPIEQEGFANRKLIRPSLNRGDHNHNNHNHMSSPLSERRERPERAERPERIDRAGGGKKAVPAEQTNAENFYYQKQMQSRTPMVIVLRDGEEVQGIIEWYDKCCLKITRTTLPNLLIYKPSIKYMYKKGENSRK